jgi:anthranilate synthase component 2/putative glutamine amidotransferase
MVRGRDAPLIGLTAYAEPARWGPWRERAVLLPEAYVQAVVAAGGVPLLLPPVPGVGEAAVRVLDGVLLTGGPDVDPERYGAQPHPATQDPRIDRDTAELGLLASAVDAALPVLGICRGLQVLNVARGGSLLQHLPEARGHSGHGPEPGVFGWHDVKVESGSRLAEIIGAAGTLRVPTSHHQAIETLGTGLRVGARADDGTVEAVEDPELPFLLAVQWHPEVGEDPALFRALVQAARARR